MDLGIYCVQGALYTMGTLPIAVTAQEGNKMDREKFREVEQSISWQLEFPHGVIAEWAEAEKGCYALDPSRKDLLLVR